MLSSIHIELLLEVCAEVTWARLYYANILAVDRESNTEVSLVFVVVYFPEHHVVSGHQTMFLVYSPGGLLDALVMPHLVPIDPSYQQRRREVLEFLLHILRKHAIWGLVDLETVLSLFVNLYFEVTTFVGVGLLCMVNIGCRVTHLSHRYDSEIPQEVPIRLETYPVVLILNVAQPLPLLSRQCFPYWITIVPGSLHFISIPRIPQFY